MKRKISLFVNTIKSILNQNRKNKSFFLLSFISYYISKNLHLPQFLTIPDSVFKFQNIELQTRKNTIDFWACLESYEPDLTYFLIQAQAKKGTFIDVGGHIGRFTVLMAKNDWNVITFEPMPSNYNMILTNLNKNSCAENFTIHNKGLGNKNEKLTMFFNYSEMGESSVVQKGNRKDKQEIEIVKFDDVYKDQIFSEPCIVKMDIEGNEENAINGMKSFLEQQKPLLILELWENNSSNITSYLKSLGYKRLHIFWFIEDKHHDEIGKMYELYNKDFIRYPYQ